MNRPANGGGRSGARTRQTEAKGQQEENTCLSSGTKSLLALKVRDRARSINAHELCDDDLAHEINGLAPAVADLAAIVASMARRGRPMNPRRLPVRPHLRSRPSRLRMSQPEFDVAIEWTRSDQRGFDRWWRHPAYVVPALYAEAFVTWGRA